MITLIYAKYLIKITRNIQYKYGNSKKNIIKLRKSLPFFRNIKFLGYFKHPSILNFVGFCPVDFEGNNLPLIFTENTPKGSLYSYLKNEKDHFSKLNNTRKLIIIYGIASAMHEIHLSKIIHRNISSKSILLDEHLYPKLFDFSYSIEISEAEKKNIFFGDINYVSPEVFCKKERCSRKSDVYAFGILVLEIITGEIPNFDDQHNFEIPDKIRSQIPDCYMNLIQQCCSNIPGERPIFSDIVENLQSGSFFKLLETKKERKKYYKYIKSLDKIYGQTFDIMNYSKILKINSEPNYIIYKIKEKQQSNKDKVDEKSLKMIFLAKSYNNFDEYDKHLKLADILSTFDHPSILKFLGYSLFNFQYQRCLTFFNENASNNTLDNILTLEKEGRAPTDWNFTKKLINIYGIASGMKYLTQKEYVHRSLSTFTILEDENFYPKISYFDYIGNYNDLYKNPDKYVHRSEYLDPETIDNELICNEASDVYAFSIIMYEMLTNEKPFSEYQTSEQIYEATKKGKRPKFNTPIPQCYKNLIISCWNKNIYKLPTFSNIVNELERNQEFLTDEIDVKEYKEYIKNLFRFKCFTFLCHDELCITSNINHRWSFCFEYIISLNFYR